MNRHLLSEFENVGWLQGTIRRGGTKDVLDLFNNRCRRESTLSAGGWRVGTIGSLRMGQAMKSDGQLETCRRKTAEDFSTFDRPEGVPSGISFGDRRDRTAIEQ